MSVLIAAKHVHNMYIYLHEPVTGNNAVCKLCIQLSVRWWSTHKRGVYAAIQMHMQGVGVGWDVPPPA